MSWKDIGRALVSKGAPLIGGVVGGPAGAVAGKLLSGVFGTDPEDPVELLNAIQADPEAMVKIKQLEARHREKLEELQLEETKAFLADVGSARERDIALTKATGKRDVNLYIMAYVVIAAFFTLILVLIFGELGTIAVLMGKDPAEFGNRLADNQIIMIIVGALISGFTQVLSFFFGSSKSSNEPERFLDIKG